MTMFRAIASPGRRSRLAAPPSHGQGAGSACATAAIAAGEVSIQASVVDAASGAPGATEGINTGICFLDHMIDQLTAHAQLRVSVRASLAGRPAAPRTNDFARLHLVVSGGGGAGSLITHSTLVDQVALSPFWRRACQEVRGTDWHHGTCNWLRCSVADILGHVQCWAIGRLGSAVRPPSPIKPGHKRYHRRRHNRRLWWPRAVASSSSPPVSLHHFGPRRRSLPCDSRRRLQISLNQCPDLGSAVARSTYTSKVSSGMGLAQVSGVGTGEAARFLAVVIPCLLPMPWQRTRVGMGHGRAATLVAHCGSASRAALAHHLWLLRARGIPGHARFRAMPCSTLRVPPCCSGLGLGGCLPACTMAMNCAPKRAGTCGGWPGYTMRRGKSGPPFSDDGSARPKRSAAGLGSRVSGAALVPGRMVGWMGHALWHAGPCCDALDWRGNPAGGEGLAVESLPAPTAVVAPQRPLRSALARPERDELRH